MIPITLVGGETMEIKKELAEELKTGTCDICKKKNIEGGVSEHFVDFICYKCLDIIDKFNAVDSAPLYIQQLKD